MKLSYLIFFYIGIISIWCLYKLLGAKYALDNPGFRKHHKSRIPQIGGICFGPLLIFLAWWFNLAPQWYLISGLVSIILGTADDVFEIGWYYKLIVQLILAVYIAIVFWGRIENIVFYNYYIAISQLILFVIFVFWFVGVYNAVNLLDGLDGLAGGFMLLVCIGTAFSGNQNFVILNLIFACLIFGFLIFNQRPADLFMGDSGSLFLGYHIAVLPLLYYDNQIQITTFSMTPFILVASYLIADTTRVFFTRIISNKSPMTADTIHFHHLVYQQSGSYLASTSSIYLITMFSVVVAALSFQQTLSSNMMIIHLSLLLFFILVPPVQTYVPIISLAITPIYRWQKKHLSIKPLLLRTLFLFFLLGSLFLSLFYNVSINLDFSHFLSLLLFSLFVLFNRDMRKVLYIIQVTVLILFTELFWESEFGVLTKLLSALICVSYLIFMFERRRGSIISNFSSLDLLFINILIGGIILSISLNVISFWYFIIIFAFWFGIRFIFCRLIFLYDEVV